MGAGSCRSVVQDIWQQSLVHLSFIKATQNKENVGAETLSQLSLVTEHAGQTVNKPSDDHDGDDNDDDDDDYEKYSPTIRKKLSNTHQIQQPLKNKNILSLL